MIAISRLIIIIAMRIWYLRTINEELTEKNGPMVKKSDEEIV